MGTIEFEFSRWEQGELSGFDLGDMTVTGSFGVHSSSGQRPDQSMMIYLGIAHLVSGVCDLAQGRQKSFEFVGTDSSYSLSFKRRRKEVVVSSGRTLLGEVTMSELLHALSRGVREFLDIPGNQLPPSEAADEDLRASLRALGHVLQQYG